MGNDYFKLNDIAEIQKFQEGLNKYFETHTNGFKQTGYFDLIKWNQICQGNKENGARIFAMIQDIKINLTFADSDVIKSMCLLETHYTKFDENNILENEEMLIHSISVLNFLSNYSFRMRALIDKIMGVIILLQIPKEYDSFRKAKSRKQKFKKLILKYEIDSFCDIQSFYESVEYFDNTFRTPEAHSVGALKKYAFTPHLYKNGKEDDKLNFFPHFNNRFISWIGTLEDSIFDKKY